MKETKLESIHTRKKKRKKNWPKFKIYVLELHIKFLCIWIAQI